MRLEHIALWTSELEDVKDFYLRYFGGTAGERFHNPQYDFSSYFVSFQDGPRLELMTMPSIPRSHDDVTRQFTGYIHVAFEVESREYLDNLVRQLREDGVRILEDPHITADDYYEATVLDPDGNGVELAVLPRGLQL